jgi:hypothetical protein
MTIEWIGAHNEPFAILTEGTYVNKYPEPVITPFAIQFGQHEGAIILGTRSELLAMLERAQQLLLKATESKHSVIADERVRSVVLLTKVDAVKVVASLVQLLVKNGMATIGDLYNLVGLSGNYKDEQWGWRDLSNSGITKTDKGYELVLPRTSLINYKE